MADGGALRRGLSPGKHRMERLLSWAWSNRVEIGIVWGLWFIWGKLAELMPAPLALVVMLAAVGLPEEDHGIDTLGTARLWEWMHEATAQRASLRAGSDQRQGATND